MYLLKDRQNNEIKAGGRGEGNDGKIISIKLIGNKTVVVTRMNRPQKCYGSQFGTNLVKSILNQQRR